MPQVDHLSYSEAGSAPQGDVLVIPKIAALSLQQLAPQDAFFNSTYIAYFLAAGHRFIDCNEQALALLGGTRTEVVGQLISRFSPERQSDGQLSSDRIQHIAETAGRSGNVFFEWQILRLDGSAIDVEAMVDRIVREGQTYLLATVRDITDRKNTERQLACSNERLRWLNQVSTRLHGKLSVDAVAEESVAILADHSSAPRVSFFMYHSDSDDFEMLACRDAQHRIEVPIGTRYPHIRHPSFDVGSDIHVINYFADSIVPQEIKTLVLARGITATVSIFLRYDGRDLGMLVLEYRSIDSLEAAQRDDLSAFGKTVSMAFANAICFADIEHQATHDALTGLPNRTMLHRVLRQMMEAATAQQQVVGLMLLDLDGFKEINDTLGHHIGDKLLREIGARLQKVVGLDTNILCRLGGDEFAVAVMKTDEHEAAQFARTMLHALKEPFQVARTTLTVGASVGISLFPRQGVDTHELLRYADIAMYNAKRSGAGIDIYDPDLDEHSPDRLVLMTELGAGIRNNQLVLHYQPKIALRTSQIHGYEALVRWQHPQRGLLGPDKFIPLAEMNEAIHPLTLKVVEMALIQQQLWRTAGLPYQMAVNLSTRNLVDRHCLDKLQALLKEFTVEPGTLEFEITETALMADPKAAAAALSSFAEMGVRLSIDDFGTGYSSLSHLIRLPINALKIDRSFVKDMVLNKQDASIVKSTIGLAHNLNIEVVAEGVEDAATLALLEQYGCDLAQGYYIGRPVSVDTIEMALQ